MTKLEYIGGLLTLAVFMGAAAWYFIYAPIFIVAIAIAFFYNK